MNVSRFNTLIGRTRAAGGRLDCCLRWKSSGSAVAKLRLLSLVLLALGVILWIRTSQRSDLEQELIIWCRELPLLNTTTNGFEVTSMKDFYGRSYGPLNWHPAIAVSSIRAIGTNSLPFLLSTLSTPDSPIENWIERHAYELRIKRIPFDNRSYLRQQAAIALVMLSPLSPEVLDRIYRLKMSPNTNIAWAARLVVDKDLNRKVRDAVNKLDGVIQ